MTRVLLPILFFASLAPGAEPYKVFCHSSDRGVLAQCESVTEKIKISSELGADENADFASASRLIAVIEGPSESGDLSSVAVQAQKPLAGTEGSRLIRDGDSVRLIEVEEKAPLLKSKSTVVIVDPNSGTSDLEVDVSAHVEGLNAGTAIVIADSLENLTIKASGYNGKDGRPAKELLAEKAVLGATGVPGSIAAAYQERRRVDQTAPLAFDDTDMNSYEASGLQCAEGETAVGTDGSYAFDNAGIRGPYATGSPETVPAGINVTALVKEEAKRTFCQRKPEFTLSQECEAEPEYSFRAVCRVQPEARSKHVFKRDPITWQRALCAPSTGAKIRRKIVRQANVNISIPGGKSFSGTVSREVKFDQTYDVLRLRTEDEKIDEALSTERDLFWYNPYWVQDTGLDGSVKLVINSSSEVANDFNGNDFPPADDDVPSKQKGSKVTFIPRTIENCSTDECRESSLFSFKENDTNWSTIAPDISAQNMIGCAPVIDLSGDATFKTSEVLGNDLKTAEKFSLYQRYFSALDASSIGFTAGDLQSANSITVSDCFAFEVVEAILDGNLSRSDWQVVSGSVDADIDLGADTGTVACISEAAPEQVGIETFVQYERDDRCYVRDPRAPPSFLKHMLGKSSDAVQADFEVANLSGRWTRANSFGTRGGQPISDPLIEAASDEEKLAIATKPVYEIIFPDSVTDAQKDKMSLSTAAGAAARQAFCVHYPDETQINPGAPDFWDRQRNPGKWPQATKSLAVPVFEFAQGAQVATPEAGREKRVCTEGVRLDLFLLNNPRPTCPVDFEIADESFSADVTVANKSSTELQTSEWSSAYSDGVWQTYDDRSEIITPQNYVVRSKILDTRYDDLPGSIFTGRTHEVHPSLYLGPGGIGDSFTGKRFPASHGFEDEAGARLHPGWARESTLFSASGAAISPDTFTPFAGSSLTQRTAAWCNAEAFQPLPGGGIGQGFGARGSLRDAPKRIFGFNLLDASDNSKNPYVGVEVTGVSSGGFFSLSSFPGLTANQLGGESLQKDDFLTENFPFIGARFEEACAGDAVFDDFLGTCRAQISPTASVSVCGSGEIWNPLRGLCQDPRETWLSTSRVVEQIDHDVERKPWAFPLTKSQLRDDDITKPFNYPFNLFGGTPRGAGQELTGNGQDELLQIGFLRPAVKMVLPDDLSVFLNRPETMSKMLLAPGFATSLDQDDAACGIRTRILAVPVDRPQIDPSNFLPAGSAIIALDTNCSEEQGLQISTMIRFLEEVDGELQLNQSDISATAGEKISVTGDVINLDFRNSASQLQYQMTDIYETLVAGLSATTGEETLVAVDIEPPEIRSRANEWIEQGKTQYGSWRSSITTGATPATTDATAQSFTCAIAENDSVLTEGSATATDGSTFTVGVRTGIWQRATAEEEAVSNDQVFTDEEISLFTKKVQNSETKLITRSALTQWTPWSHELTDAAPKHPDFLADQPFGNWTEIGSLQPGASVPDCSIYSDPTSPDTSLTRSSFNDVPKEGDLTVDDEFTVFRIKNPLDLSKDFIQVPFDPDLRASKSCLRWDTVRGDRCEQSHPTVQGPDLAPLVFGGEWENVFVERKERVSQECSVFGWSEVVSLVNGEPVGSADFSRCRKGNRCVAGANAPIVTDQNGVTGPRAFNPDGTCFEGELSEAGALVQDSAATDHGPNRRALRDPRVEFCTPDSCPFQVNVQTFQVDTATPASGAPGEDGTDAGSAIVFCRDCPNIVYEGLPGSGGQGSNPVASDRSKTLTCVSSNNNPLNPIFSVRHLWSQPFVGGAAGQNGRVGRQGDGIQVYQDVVDEALWLLSQPNFWEEGSLP